MLNWISSIYPDPTARVRANGVLSDLFRIPNGTRQGSPLSPLFAPSLEPLLCTVRLNPDISGVIVGGAQQKVSAYADDMLFSYESPNFTTKALTRI